MKKIVISISVLLLAMIANAQTGNVGIGTNTPAGKLDVNGDLALREGAAITVSGNNPAVSVSLTTANPENSFYRITGSPTGTMTLNSIANGVDGQIIALVNTTGIKLNITNNNAANGILTATGTPLTVPVNGNVTIQYSTNTSRWYILSASTGGVLPDWVKANTASDPAGTLDSQYVNAKIGIGDFNNGAPGGSNLEGWITIKTTSGTPSIVNPVNDEGLILQGSGGTPAVKSRMRLVSNSLGWTDDATTTYLQFNTDNNRRNLTLMGGGYGNDVTLNRFQINSDSTQITDYNFGATPIPGSLLEVVSGKNAAKNIFQIKGIAAQTGNFLDITSSGGSLGNIMTVKNNGNVGINTITPVTKLDVAGDLALREGAAITVSGNNPAVSVSLTTANPENSFYRITGSPTGTMTLNSIANGVDGQLITLVNATTIKLKISNNNVANGILTSGGAATLIAANGSITLQYSSGAARWYVTNAAGATVTDWIKATTADETAISTDNQYVTGNVGLGGHTGGASDNTYNFANNAPAVPLVVVSPGTAVPASTPTSTGIRLALPGTIGTKWPLSSDFKLGSYATSGVNAQSQLDIALGNGATSTPDVTVMSILGNGNVGIGTTNPADKLHLFGNSSKIVIDNGINATSEIGIVFRNGDATGSQPKSAIISKGYNNWKRADMYFVLDGAADDGPYDISTDTKMIIKAESGNVGINTSAPTSQLFVKSADNTSTTEIATFMANNSTYGVGITYNGIKATGSNAVNALYLDAKSTGDILMQTTSTGDVGIGTTDPKRKLEVNNAMKFTNSSADANDGVIGTAPFDVGLNIVGINTDVTSRKISMWGAIKQVENGTGNKFVNTNYFEGDGNMIQIGSPGATSNPTILPRNPIGGSNPTYLRLGSSTNSLQDLYSNYIYVNSKVHIGGTSPTSYPLLVDGSNSWTGWNRWYDDPYGLSWSGWSSSTASVAIYAPQSIMTDNYFIAASDRRIKRNIHLSDASNDLNTLNQIEISDYHFIDTIGNTNKPFKKVIAQQVESVYPQAISNTTNFIPNVYTAAAVSNNLVLLNMDKQYGLNTGDVVKIIDIQGAAHTDTILEINPSGFKLKTLQLADGNCFVYGKMVNDFKVVDYDAISMLNVSATQELYKKIMALQTENEQLKKEIVSKADIQQINDLKAEMDNLKRILLLLMPNAEYKK